MRRADAIALAVAALAGHSVVGCGSEPSEPANFVMGPIIVDAREDDLKLDQDLSGTVALVGGCVVMLSETSNEPRGVEWPPGTTWDEGLDAIVLPDQRLVNIGDFIVGGGDGYGIDDDALLSPEVRAALEQCGIEAVWHLTHDIVTGEAALAPSD